MPNDHELNLSPDKGPHERFTDLGKKLLAVPKAEVDQREAAWQKQKRKMARRKKR